MSSRLSMALLNSLATLPCDSRRYRSSRGSSCSQTATSSGAGGYPAPRKPTPTQVEGSAVHSSAGQSVMETFHDSKFNQGGRTEGLKRMNCAFLVY